MNISLSRFHLVGQGYIYQTVPLTLRMGAPSYVIILNTVYLDVIVLMYKRFYCRKPSAQKWRNIRDIGCVECFHPEDGSCSTSQNSKATSHKTAKHRYSTLNRCGTSVIPVCSSSKQCGFKMYMIPLEVFGAVALK